MGYYMILWDLFLWEYIWQNNASRNTSYMGWINGKISGRILLHYTCWDVRKKQQHTTLGNICGNMCIYIMQYYTTFRSSWTYIGNIGCILMGIHLEIYLAESIQFTVHINIGNYYMIIYVGEKHKLYTCKILYSRMREI